MAPLKSLGDNSTTHSHNGFAKELPVSANFSDQPMSSSPELARVMLETAAQAILAVDANGLISLVNATAEQLFGYSREEILGQPIEVLIPTHLRDAHKGHRAEYFAQPRSRPMGISLELSARRKDGSEFPVEISLSYLESTNGVWTVAFVSDITKRKQAESELRQERNFVSHILETIGAIVVVLDPHGRIVKFNRACESVSGYSFEEVEGKHLWDFLLIPEEVGPVKAVFEDLVTHQLPNRFENYWVTKSGECRRISWSNTVLRNEEGMVTQVIGTGIDITELKEATGKLKESEERFRYLAEATKIVPWEGEVGNLNFTYLGPRAVELLGYPLEQWYEEGFWASRIHPEDRESAVQFCLESARIREEFEFEYRMIAADERTLWVRDIVHVVRGDHTPRLMRGFLIDITTRKEAVLALNRTQEELQALTARLLTAAEDQSKQMARELHDAFGQKLALFNLRVSEVEALVKPQPEMAAEKLRACREQIGVVAQEMQEFSRLLHPSVLHELGLEVALRSECEAYSRRTGTVVNFAAENVPEVIPENIGLCLYRIAQESLQNIWKHAESNRVDVTLRATGGEIELIVEDFGKGFDLESTRGKGGLGLISMQERVRLVGGSLSITTKAGDGTQVQVRIPLRRD